MKSATPAEPDLLPASHPAETQSLRGLPPGGDLRVLWALWVEALRDLGDCRHARIYMRDEEGWLRAEFPPHPLPASGADAAPGRDAGDEGRAEHAFSSATLTRNEAGNACVGVWAPMIDELDECVGVIEATLPRQPQGFTEAHVALMERLGLPLARVFRACQKLDAPDASRVLYSAWREMLALRTPLEEKANPSVGAQRNHEEMQARRYSEEKMAGIARLAAGVAHEVNNPLSVALANLGPWEEIAQEWEEQAAQAARCLERGDYARAQEYLQAREREAAGAEWRNITTEVRAALQRIARVVAQLQRFGEQSRHEQEAVLLGDEVERAAALFRWGDASRDPLAGSESATRAGRRPVDLEVCVHARNPVWGNRDRIRQILMELMENALRAAAQPTPAGGDANGRGRVCVEVSSDAGRSIIRVSDNGPGIDIESQQRIFDPFYTTKTSWRSPGLGLTAVYGMVKAMRGQITIESTPGRGARFSIHFPSGTPHAEASEGESATPASDAALPPTPPGQDDASPHRAAGRSGRYYQDLA